MLLSSFCQALEVRCLNLRNDRVDQLTKIVRTVRNSVSGNPSIELFTFHKNLSFNSVAGEGMASINKAIPQPSDRSARIGRQRLEIEIAWR